MKQINLKRQLFAASTFISIIVLLVFIAVIIPRIQQIRSLHQTIFETHKAVEREHEKTRHARKSLRELATANDFAEQISTSVLSPGQELAVITELERISETHNIEQTINISIQEVKDIKWLPTPQLKRLGITEFYTISLLNHGTFKNHIAYLHDIERLPYRVVIDGLQMQGRTSDDTETPEVTLRVDGYIFIDSQN